MSSEESYGGEESSYVSSSYYQGRESTQAIMELLDEYWFFHNTLERAAQANNKDLIHDVEEYLSIAKTGVEEEGTPSTPKTKATGMLLRMLSLPPIEIITKEEEKSRTSSKVGRSKLMRQLSSPLQAHQTESSPSLCKSTRLDTSISRQNRPPRDTKPEGTKNYCLNQQHPMARESKWKKAFLEKKWKSLSDLEYEEVQGFEDLGFVFDKAELSASLVQVIPGLRGDQPTTEDGSRVASQRPYLSEAWFVKRSAPPAIRWDDRRSPAHMKEQLKFWARTVARNMRQEC